MWALGAYLARQLSLSLLESTMAAPPTRNRQLGMSMLRWLPKYLPQQQAVSAPHLRLLRQEAMLCSASPAASDHACYLIMQQSCRDLPSMAQRRRL